MIFLYILLALVALVLLTLYVNVHLILRFDGTPQVFVRVLFVKVDAMRLAKSLGGEKPKKKKKEKPEKAKKSGEGQPKKKKPKGSIFDFLDFIALITRIVTRAVADLIGKLRINLKEFTLRFSAGDADQTALVYGGAIQAANALFALLSRFTHFRWNDRNLTLSPDFTGESQEFRIHLVLTVKPVQLLSIALRALMTYLEGKETRK